MATVKHIQVNTLPDTLEPGAIYFVRETGQIIQTDLNGVPVEFGSHILQMNFSGSMYIEDTKTTVPNIYYGIYERAYTNAYSWYNSALYAIASAHIPGRFIAPGYKLIAAHFRARQDNTQVQWAGYIGRRNIPPGLNDYGAQFADSEILFRMSFQAGNGKSPHYFFAIDSDYITRQNDNITVVFRADINDSDFKYYVQSFSLSLVFKKVAQ